MEMWRAERLYVYSEIFCNKILRTESREFHLLLCCLMTQRLWCPLWKLFGVNRVRTRNVKDMLLGWKLKGRKHRRTWDIAPLILTWVVWEERNMKTFEGVENPFVQIVECFVPFTLLEWYHISVWWLSYQNRLSSFGLEYKNYAVQGSTDD